MHCACWIGHHTGTHVNLHSSYAHRSSLKFRCCECCGCCAAAAGTPQPISSVIHSHATPGLVGSRSVAIVLLTTLTTSNQSYLDWEISLCTLFPILLISLRLSYLRVFFLAIVTVGEFDPCRAWGAVPEPPSAARQLSELLIYFGCDWLFVAVLY